jgi:hypothetical protein
MCVPRNSGYYYESYVKLNEAKNDVSVIYPEV